MLDSLLNSVHRAFIVCLLPCANSMQPLCSVYACAGRLDLIEKRTYWTWLWTFRQQAFKLWPQPACPWLLGSLQCVHLRPPYERLHAPQHELRRQHPLRLRAPQFPAGTMKKTGRASTNEWVWNAVKVQTHTKSREARERRRPPPLTHTHKCIAAAVAQT